MSRNINFEDAKTNMEKPLASGYSIMHPDESGELVTVYEFDGDEQINTVCPGCGRNHLTPLDEFFKIAGEDFDLYGTSLYCHECSAKMLAEREGITT